MRDDPVLVSNTRAWLEKAQRIWSGQKAVWGVKGAIRKTLFFIVSRPSRRRSRDS